MDDKPANDKQNFGWLIPAAVTTVWFGIVAWYLSLPFEKGGEKLYWFTKIAALDPNNFGDFLSGAFAPVAFFWLAYSVWIQRIELIETRKVLKEQGESQKASADAANRLSKSTEDQIKISKKSSFSEIIKNYAEFIDKFNLETGEIMYFIGGSHKFLYTSFHPRDAERSSKSIMDISEDILKISELAKEQYFPISDNENKKISSYLSHMRLMLDAMHKLCSEDHEMIDIFLGGGYARLQYCVEEVFKHAKR